MKRLFLVVVMLAAIAAFAQSPFDGTWKVIPSKVEFSPKPYEYKVANGNWTCASCVPKYTVKADGNPQQVSGNPYYDKLSAKLVDDNTVETESSKAGKTVAKSKFKVSDDGKTLTVDYEDFSSVSGEPVKQTTAFSRVGSAPSSGNKVSGQWKVAKVEDVSDNFITFTFTGSGDELTYKAATGDGYTAKMDGKDYPYHGDPGVTSVALKAIDDHTFEETDKRDGKVIFVQRITVSPDSKTMTVAGQDKLRNTTVKWTAEKQAGAAMGK